MSIYYNKYTINTYDDNGKYTLMQPFTDKPMFFDSKQEAETYAENQGMDLEEICIESENEWNKLNMS